MRVMLKDNRPTGSGGRKEEGKDTEMERFYSDGEKRDRVAAQNENLKLKQY